MSLPRLLAVALLLGPALSAPVGAEPIDLTEPARVTALAVSVNETGELVGANASIEVRVADEGSGHVFMDTRPLSGTDLQGSARIAACRTTTSSTPCAATRPSSRAPPRAP